MNKLSLFNFGPHEVRETKKNGEPWFIAKDICEALGYVNSRKAVADHVAEEDKGVTKCDTLGGVQELNFVNESGLYALIFGSTKPEAKAFKHWVTHEVLPSIRKEGVYRLENRVAELAAKVEDRTDMYFEAVADLKKAKERYTKSHQPLSLCDREQIQALLHEGKSDRDVAEQTGRSMRTVQKIKKEMKERKNEAQTQTLPLLWG